MKSTKEFTQVEDEVVKLEIVHDLDGGESCSLLKRKLRDEKVTEF